MDKDREPQIGIELSIMLPDEFTLSDGTRATLIQPDLPEALSLVIGAMAVHICKTDPDRNYKEEIPRLIEVIGKRMTPKQTDMALRHSKSVLAGIENLVSETSS